MRVASSRRTVIPGSRKIAAVTLSATLDCHNVIGGTARARVREALAAAEHQIDSLSQKEKEAAHVSA